MQAEAMLGAVPASAEVVAGVQPSTGAPLPPKHKGIDHPEQIEATVNSSHVPVTSTSSIAVAQAAAGGSMSLNAIAHTPAGKDGDESRNSVAKVQKPKKRKNENQGTAKKGKRARRSEWIAGDEVMTKWGPGTLVSQWSDEGGWNCIFTALGETDPVCMMPNEMW
jgi:hypothetical protein